MSRDITRRSVLAGIGTTGAVAVAGCSSGGGGNSADARVGVLQPTTGDLGDLGAPIQDAGVLPVTQLQNEGVEYTLESRREDTETNPSVGVDRAQALATAGYPSITGAASSAVTIRVAEEVLFQQEVVGISPASTSPAITDLDGDYLLRTCPTDALQGVALTNLAYEDRGLESVATLYLNNDYGQGLNDAFVSSFQEAGGEVLAEQSFQKQQPSYSSVLSDVLSDTPDALLVIGYPASGTQIFRNFYERNDAQDYTVLVTDGLQENGLPSDVDNSMENVIGTAPAATGPGRDTFDQLYQDEYGTEPGVYNAQAYDATAVHILAQLRAGELSGPAISEEIRAVANPGGEVIGPGSLAEGLEMAANGTEIQYQGASSNVEFDENGDLSAAVFNVFEYSREGYEVTDRVNL